VVRLVRPQLEKHRSGHSPDYTDVVRLQRLRENRKTYLVPFPWPNPRSRAINKNRSFVQLLT